MASVKAVRRVCAFRHGFDSRTGSLNPFSIGTTDSHGVFPLRFPSPFDPLHPSSPFPPSHPTRPTSAMRLDCASPWIASIDARIAIRRPFASPNPTH